MHFEKKTPLHPPAPTRTCTVSPMRKRLPMTAGTLRRASRTFIGAFRGYGGTTGPGGVGFGGFSRKPDKKQVFLVEIRRK